MKTYLIRAASWGVNLQLKIYTDDRVIVDDFNAGKCDAAGMMGIRACEFLPYTGTITSIGGI